MWIRRLKTVQAFLEPPIDESFEAAVSPVKVADIQSSLNVGCVLIGPFSQDESARIEALNLDIAASSWLTEGLAEQRRLIAGPEEYRVYAGPAESLNAAYQMLKDFRESGIGQLCSDQWASGKERIAWCFFILCGRRAVCEDGSGCEAGKPYNRFTRSSGCHKISSARGRRG